MGFAGSLLGMGGGGMSYSADGVSLDKPVDLAQTASSYSRAQDALDKQKSYLAALQGQNALGNQNSVFQQQQGLAGILGAQALGYGPNPALAQLAQTTGQNVAAQRALMASQRGAGANVGLLARQAAMQGANIQQQATGQAATLSAQQQIAAMNALQQQQASMGSLATAQANQLAGGYNNYNQAAQSEQQMLLNALSNYNQQQVNMQSNINSANAGVQAQTAAAQGNLLGGGLAGIGASFGLAHGGVVPDIKHYSGGGSVMPTPSGPQSFAARFLTGWQSGENAGIPNNTSSFSTLATPSGSMGATGAMIGKAIGQGVQSLFSPTATQISAPGTDAFYASNGAVVPGKAAVKGDSLKNDTVPAMLSPGEVVLPRSVMNSKDPVNNAAKFVADVLAKKKGALRK